MFRSRVYKIWGDVWSRKGRTALVATAIFIGVAGTIALFSMGDILVRQLKEDVKEDELSMLDIFITVTSETTLDNEAYLEGLRAAVPEITDVLGITQSIAYYKLNDDDDRFSEGIVNSYSVSYEDGLPITPLRLVDGQYPSQGQNEIVIEQRMAEKYDLQVGDEIFFRVLSDSRDGSGVIGTVEAWTITGLVFHPYAGSTAGPGQAGPEESVYMVGDDANYVSGLTGYTIISSRFAEYPSENTDVLDAVADYIAESTAYIPVFKLSEDPAQNSLIVGAQTIAATMGFLALVALIVSGFLVINVISSIVVEQKRQIGVMKSMGATRWDNIFIYAGIAFTYGLIGVIPGVIVGIPGGNAAAHALAPTLNTLLEGFRFSPSSIIIGVFVGLFIPVAASILPVFLGTRVKILDAMTDLGIDANYGTGPIARFIEILPISITVRQGLSNVSLKKTRLALTVVTLSIAAGAFMGIFAVFSSLTDGIGLFIDIFNVDVGIIPSEGYDPDLIFSIISENYQTGDDPIIASAEAGFQFQVEFEGYSPLPSAGGPPGIFAYGYAVESKTPAFNVTVDEGERLALDNAENGIIFSSMLANNMGKSVGDRVVLEVPGNSAELIIVGISEFPLDQVWIDWRTLAKIVGYTVGAPRPNQYLTTVSIGDEQQEVSILGMDLTAELFGGITFGQILTLKDGAFFSAGEQGVIISRGLADQGYAVGDTLSITATGGNSSENKITGIVEVSPMVLSDQIPAEFVGIYWEELAALEDLSLEGKPLPQGYWLTTSLVDPTSDEIDILSDEIKETMLDQGISVTPLNFVALVEQISQGFLIFQVILQLVAGLIALVGALGLLTTLSMSVFERQKEIGVMRSIGASSTTVAVQFLTEGFVVGIISWLIGIPLAYMLQVALLNVTGFSETFPTTFSISGTLVGLVGMLLITVVASLWPSLSAARKTVSEVLRYQ